MGYVSFFENFIQIVVLLFAWVMVLLAFFILAIQLFVTLIEFKLTTLAGFVLIPFGLFGKTAFLAERVLGNVVSSGVKVLVLAVIVGIGSTLFSQFTPASAATSRRSRTPWRSCWPRSRCSASASSGPASPTASSPAARSLAPAPPSARPRRRWRRRGRAPAAGMAGRRSWPRLADRCRRRAAVLRSPAARAPTAYRAGGARRRRVRSRRRRARLPQAATQPTAARRRRASRASFEAGGRAGGRRSGRPRPWRTIGGAASVSRSLPAPARLGPAHEARTRPSATAPPPPPMRSAPAISDGGGASVDLSEGE